MNRLAPLRLALSLAKAELRGGLGAFRIVIACLGLGVGAIAVAGTMSASVSAGIARDSRALLGGDVELGLVQRTATTAERDFLAGSGRLSVSASLRAMAQGGNGGGRRLVELKAVDAAYPLYGTLALDWGAPAPAPASDRSLSAALAKGLDGWGAAVEPALAVALGLRLGEAITIGRQSYRLRAFIAAEPDRGTQIFTLGPRVLVSLDSLADSGLIEPGSLVNYAYRIRFPASVDGAAWRAELAARFPAAGWRVRGPEDAAPGIERLVGRTRLFMTLVGLTSLIMGGLGIAIALGDHLVRRGPTIATMKCLGASSGLVFAIHGCTIALIAGLGIALGLALGAGAPILVGPLLGRVLAIGVEPGLYLRPLLLAAGFGLLVAALFAYWPLARTRDIRPAALFRAAVAPARSRLALADGAILGLGAAALSALCVTSAGDRNLAAGFLVALMLAFALFRLAAFALQRLARRRGFGRNPSLRLALANLHRPGAPTVAILLALGMGLSVLAALALVQSSLTRAIEETVPATAPTFYLLDIQPDQIAGVEAMAKAEPGATGIDQVPMLRGRLSALAGVPVDRLKAPPDLAWVLQGDRGVTWAATVPAGTRLVAGSWWTPDYAGPALVSLDAEVARGFHLKLGDSLTVNVLGRELSATITNLREIDWSKLGINFVMVFTPGLLDKAPQTWLATVHLPAAGADDFERRLIDRYPNVTAVRVAEAIAAIARVVRAVEGAVSAVGLITLGSGLLVLAGVVASARRRRAYEGVILKVLGAERRQILAALALEYGMIGLAAACLAALIGSLCAWAFVTLTLELAWSLDIRAVIVTLLGGLALALGLGLGGSLASLRRPPARELRNP